jgi:hypothetical protein
MWLPIDVPQQLSHTYILPNQKKNDKTTTVACRGDTINLRPNSTSLSDAAATAHSRVVPEHPVDPGPLIGPTPPASAPSAPPITSHSFTCNHHGCLPRRSQPLVLSSAFRRRHTPPFARGAIMRSNRMAANHTAEILPRLSDSGAAVPRVTPTALVSRTLRS